MSDVERLTGLLQESGLPSIWEARVTAEKLIKVGVLMPHSTDVEEFSEEGIDKAAWFCDCGDRGDWIWSTDVGVESVWAEASQGADDHRMQNGLA